MVNLAKGLSILFTFSMLFFILALHFLCIWVFYPLVCLCIHVSSVLRGCTMASDPLNWWLWVTMWVWELVPRSPGIVASALNCRTVSPVLCLSFQRTKSSIYLSIYLSAFFCFINSYHDLLVCLFLWASLALSFSRPQLSYIIKLFIWNLSKIFDGGI